MFSNVRKFLDIKESEIDMMWDFTVGSSKSLTSRFLSMRKDAFDRIENKQKGIY